MRTKCIFLDYAATTPVSAEVLSVMELFFSLKYGNPGSLHLMGQEAKRAVDDAREQMKNFLNASSLREIIFTGSATEANNLAIFGVVKALGNRTPRPHIITTAIEHKSVLAPCQELEKSGVAEVTYLKVSKEGFMNVEELKQALRPETVLVSVMYANNEIGAIQPIAEIAEVIKNFRSRRLETGFPYFHCDAVQAAGFFDLDAQKLGVDLMTISGHKIYGPKGIGALYVREGIKIQPLTYGGEQEYGMRPGTEAVSLIVGLGKAAEITAKWKSKKDNIEKISKLRDYLINKLLEISGVYLNGSREKRLPNNVNIALTGHDTDSLLIGLFEEGICVSSGAACGARGREPSYVVYAISRDRKRAVSSLRITLGRETNKKEIDLFLKKLIGTLARRLPNC